MRKKIYVDMCADLFHAGHVQYLAQCKQYCDDVYLIVGIHNDETIASYKRPPICTMEERRIVLKSCKYVDEVVLNAPLQLKREYLIENNIDYVIHADGIDPKEAEHMYSAAIELGLYIEVPRTEGISTTDLIQRVEQRKLNK
jgi:cytidyltransferase-like protein